MVQALRAPLGIQRVPVSSFQVEHIEKNLSAWRCWQAGPSLSWQHRPQWDQNGQIHELATISRPVEPWQPLALAKGGEEVVSDLHLTAAP